MPSSLEYSLHDLDRKGSIRWLAHKQTAAVHPEDRCAQSKLVFSGVNFDLGQVLPSPAATVARLSDLILFFFTDSSFGSLFSGAERMGDPMGPYVNLKYSGSSPDAAESVTPALSTMRARSSAERKTRSNSDVFDGDNL